MPGLSPHSIRFGIQLAFALAALFAVVFVPMPYGPTAAFLLLVFGLWFGRRVFRRLGSLDDIKRNWPDRSAGDE
ncbi:MAG: hypothetical protein JJ902_18405 [Roseibium sp.]|nr:hypothetical protein [Roseibium sp.]